MYKKQEIINKILKIISDASNSITADEIYKTLNGQVDPGRTQETIRGYIRDLVKDGNYLIGSSNRGYFHIDSPGKLDKAINNLEARSKSLKQRIKILKKSWDDK
ncbi:MAG: hypothetical protein ISS80_04670 [Candidatus Cloacimonetes bacterium]|nr:hypothetical protein [Candidatus Cloacimonadota bacterium]MBL7149348.1 hypothetical protein [Candidatus Cloacimonadota bacterium]